MKTHTESLALKRVVDNVTFTSKKAIAWYVLAPQRWSFRTDAECDALLLSHAQGLAQLVGKRLHQRVTTRPYPVDQWARDLDANTPNPLPGWGAHLVGEQRHLLGQTLADKLVYYGVEMTVKEAGAAQFHTGRATANAEQTRRELDVMMSLPGFDGIPATAAEVEWLLRRSVALGSPAPSVSPFPSGVWDAEDIPELGEGVTWDMEPYGRTLRVCAVVGGEQVERHVSILTVGRMGTLEIPGEMEPWQQRTDRLPFPCEWSGLVDVLPNEQVIRDMQGAMLKIRSQVAHFVVEHGLDAPLQLQRQNTRALEVEDELAAGFDGLSTRTAGWYRVAVSGVTPDEALSRAQAVVNLYSPAISMVQAADLYRVAREFIPGEPLSSVAYKRRLSVTTVAGGLPAATAVVGDSTGSHIGYTCGASERAVMWDTHASMEIRERSGLTLIAGGLGAGKSTLTGQVVYKSVMRRIPWVLLDPSGPLARLTELPELRAFSRHINLLNADPGTLNPYRVVAEPARHHYKTDSEYVRASAMAQAQRRNLCADVLSMLLPGQVDELPQTRMALLRAGRAVGGARTASPRQVIAKLRDLDGSLEEHGAILADFLDEAAEMPQAQLIFPAGDEAGGDLDTSSHLLTVLTLAGLTTPREGIARKDLTLDEMYSTPLIHLAAWLTQRSIYDRTINERKGVAFDELHVLAALASGRSLLNRTARDSRKWNLRALYCSQNIADTLTAGVGNFLDNVFIGRTEDEDAQREALRALRIPTGAGYEAVLGGLSPNARRGAVRRGPRQFIFSDGSDGIEKIRVDLAGTPSLLAALDTTADPSKATNTPAGGEGVAA